MTVLLYSLKVQINKCTYKKQDTTYNFIPITLLNIPNSNKKTGITLNAIPV